MTCGKWSHNYVGGVCLNGCGIPQQVIRTQKIEHIVVKKPQKNQNYAQQVVEPHLSKLNWQNETLEKDTRAFWMAVYKLNKQRPTLLRETIEWAANNRLHPMQFVKAVNTICRGTSGTKDSGQGRLASQEGSTLQKSAHFAEEIKTQPR